MQEKKAADDMLLKLKEENAKLRQNQKVWSEDVSIFPFTANHVD